MKKKLKRNKNYLISLVVIIGFFVYSIFCSGSPPFEISLDRNSITLSCDKEQTHTVQFKDIVSITQTSELNFGEYLRGETNNQYCHGVWYNSEWGEYYLCINVGVEKYIVVETTKEHYVFNIESESVSSSYYDALWDTWQLSSNH